MVIFSRPGTPEQAKRIEQDPRYWQQRARHSPARLPEAASGFAWPAEVKLDGNASFRGKNKLNEDWSQDLGTGGTIGATNYPAKFSFQIATANCASAAQPDFVVYGTGLAGSATQATIAAFDNLYSGCSGTVPTVYWAYDTGGAAVTSPVFSLDGKQIAFVQTGGGYASTLVLLKWAASTTETIGSPMTLAPLPHSLYPACIGPCMTTLTLQHAGINEKDSNSSVFYDYANDVAYVGDDAGWLHKYTPVFKGVPTQIFTGGWPVQVGCTPGLRHRVKGVVAVQ
jgi:hypothetical protein